MPDGLGRPAVKSIVELLNSFTLASLCRHRFIITKNNTHGGGRDSGVSRLNATLKRQTPYSLVSCCIQWFPPWWLSVSHAQRSEAGRQGRRSPHSRASMAWGGSLSLGFLNLSFSFRRALSTSTGSVFPVNFCTPSSLQWRKTDKWSKMKQNLNKTGDVAHIQPRCVEISKLTRGGGKGCIQTPLSRLMALWVYRRHLWPADTKSVSQLSKTNVSFKYSNIWCEQIRFWS